MMEEDAQLDGARSIDVNSLERIVPEALEANEATGRETLDPGCEVPVVDVQDPSNVN